MAPVTNQMLNAKREKNCIGITTERKYLHAGQSFIKRSLRPSEWQINPGNGTFLVPRFDHEHSVPKFYSCFEDEEAAYLVVEYVEGVAMSSLDVEKRQVVEKEIEGHLETLRRLKSSVWGGPSGIVIPPYRVMVKAMRQQWKMKPRESEDLVFCHNDLSTHNIIVDPVTLKVKAIIDWEYAGFYPKEFEGMFFRRPGPSVALQGEIDDEDRLLNVILENEMK